MADCCAHCDLPLRRRVVTAAVDGKRLCFCCYGCALALQITRARGESGAAASILVRLGLAVFFAMNVMMVSLPTYAPYLYGPDAAPRDGALFQVLHALALVFAAPVLVLLGWPILVAAARGAREWVLAMDALIVLGTLAAYGLSVYHTITGAGPVYFDTAAMLLVVVTLGRYLEARARAEASSAVSGPLACGPVLATRVGAAGDERTPAEALLPGDVVRVAAGEAFVTDGRVLEGNGGVDEAMLTGESRPVSKEPGAAVAGGSCSLDGCFTVRVTATVADSTAARIARSLARVRRQRTVAERAAERAARIFVPLVLAVALAAGLWWARHAGVDRGVLIGLSVLVVACPCALGIATPLAVWIGILVAARRGVIVRSASALERARDVDLALFDKTGTLTDRLPALVACEPAPGSPLSAHDLLARAALLEAGVRHPFAESIARVVAGDPAAARRMASLRARGVRVVPGRGVRGRVDGKELAIGSAKFAADDLGQAANRPGYASSRSSTALLWEAGRVLGALHFEERARPEGAAAIGALRRMGVSVEAVSGDACAVAIVPQLFSSGEVAMGLTPEQKVAHVQGRRRAHRAVAMVGDGLNDAPAVAAADVGIAVGGATDLTRMSAHVAIIRGDLECVPWLLAHARRVGRVLRQNLVWAFGYNTVAVAVAAAGFLNPLVASVAMLGSSLAVVANARRLAAPTRSRVWSEESGMEGRSSILNPGN